MKITKVNQNQRRRSYGNLVAGFLNYFGDASAENLTRHIHTRSNRSMAEISSAVRRTLGHGRMQGFLVKKNRKYSLSGRSNETDCDRGRNTTSSSGFSHRSSDTLTRSGSGTRRDPSSCTRRDPHPPESHEKPKHSKMEKECKEACDVQCEDEENRTATSCPAKNLLTHLQCDRSVPPATAKERTKEFCNPHTQLDKAFKYRILFTKTFLEQDVQNAISRHDAKLYEHIQEEKSIFSDNEEKDNEIQVTEDYLKFLKRYYNFIFKPSENNFCDNELVLKVLMFRYHVNFDTAGTGGCRGVDFGTGGKCVRRERLTQLHEHRTCVRHRRVYSMMKGFTHVWDRDSIEKTKHYDAFTDNVVEAVFRTGHRAGHCTDVLISKDEIVKVALCNRWYLALVVRLEAFNIISVIDRNIFSGYGDCLINSCVSSYR